MKKTMLLGASFLIALFLMIFVTVPALAYVVVDENGNLIFVSGQVLGDDDGDDDDNSGSGSSGSGSGDDDDDEDEDDDDRDEDDEDEDDDSSDSDDDSDEVKQEISISQVPTAALNAAKNAVAGIVFTEAKIIGTGTAAVYKLEGIADGQGYEVEVTGTGTVLEVEQEVDSVRIKEDEERTEVRLPGGVKVKTRIEDGRSRTDVYQGGTKVRFEREDGRFRIKVEDETGAETEVGEDDILTIDERLDRNQIRLRTFTDPNDLARHRAIIERLNTQAVTDLPLAVDLETNELIVTTPAGERTVTVLPDQAVQNMLAANVVDRIGGPALVEQIRAGGLTALDKVVELAERDGVPIYEINGVKDRRLFGFIPVSSEVTLSVSVETGEILDTEQSFADTLVDIFSTDV